MWFTCLHQGWSLNGVVPDNRPDRSTNRFYEALKRQEVYRPDDSFRDYAEAIAGRPPVDALIARKRVQDPQAYQRRRPCIDHVKLDSIRNLIITG